MDFISTKFVAFLVILVAIYYITPKKYRYLSLLAGSYVYYFLSSKWLTGFLILSTLSIYVLGRMLGKENLKTKQISADLSREEKKALKENIKLRKRCLVFAGIVLNFGILAVLKYVTHFAVSHGFDWAGKIGLPLGISYYTLMAVSYIVDVYRGKIEADKHLPRLALWLAFFPQMTEGPIANYEETARRLYRGHRFTFRNFKHGCLRILIGLAKVMVIARRAGIFVDAVFAEQTTGWLVFAGAAMYTLQIYADFSGCMDIVLGVARLFGVKLPENFRQPFFSRSIQEFWRRWHVTLGAWIKNYIFYPVSLSKMNMKVSSFFRKHLPKGLAGFLVVAFPLLFVWLYNGIWHGAGWKYVGYGLYYYALIMIGILLAPWLKKLRAKLKIKDENWAFRIYEILRTLVLVIFGMMLFRSHSLSSFAGMFKDMFVPAKASLLDFGLVGADFVVLGACVLALLVVGILNERRDGLYLRILKKNLLVRYAVFGALVLAIVILGIYGDGYDASNFIYGQF